MRRLIGSGACLLAVALLTVALMSGARAAAVSAPPRAARQATVRDRGLALQLQHLLASANPLAVTPHRALRLFRAARTQRGAIRGLAPHAPSMCFVAGSSCPLTPCVVPVTARQITRLGASSGRCPMGARRAEPSVSLLVNNSTVTAVAVMGRGVKILDPSGHRLSASP